MQTNRRRRSSPSRKLRELTAGPPQTERDAVIVVDKTNDAAGKVRLNYLVDAASWRPQYKLRAGKEAKDPVQLEYLAAVVQQTGEDWSNVNLVLSTAQPMLNAAPPDLQTPPRRRACRAGSRAGPASTTWPWTWKSRIKNLRNQGPEGLQREARQSERHRPVQHRRRPRPVLRAAQPRGGRQDAAAPWPHAKGRASPITSTRR